jgi:hypothetical protein
MESMVRLTQIAVFVHDFFQKFLGFGGGLNTSDRLAMIGG